MSNKYILQDILETEKNMTVNMAIALNEASWDNIYDVYYDMFKELSKEAKELFNIAFNNNWYQLEEADNNKVCQEYSKLSKELGNEDS